MRRSTGRTSPSMGLRHVRKSPKAYRDVARYRAEGSCAITRQLGCDIIERVDDLQKRPLETRGGLPAKTGPASGPRSFEGPLVKTIDHAALLVAPGHDVDLSHFDPAPSAEDRLWIESRWAIGTPRGGR